MARYVQPLRTKLRLGIGCAVLSAMLALAIPQVLRYLVDHVFREQARPGTIWASAGAMALLGILQVAFIWFRRALVIEQGTHMELAMRQALFDQLARLPVTFHDAWPSGQLLSRSMSDLGMIRRWYAFGLVQLVTSATSVAVGLVLMFLSSWQLGLLYLVALPAVLAVLWRRLTGIRTQTREARQLAGDLATEVEESVHGIRVLKALGRADHALAKFSERSAALRTVEVARAQNLGAMTALTWLIPEITLAVGLAWAGYLVAAGSLSAGATVAFFATSVLVTTRVRDSGMIMNLWLASSVARERHYQIMTVPGREAVPITGVTHPVATTGEGTGAALEFREVSFAYEDAPERPLLRGVDLALRPGETMALVGSTGCGKSTLLSLVPRLHQATGGQVLLDGEDIAGMELDRLRGQLSLAFEEPTLFSASVRENVLLGLPEPTDAEGNPVDWEELEGPGRARREELLEQVLDVASAGFAHALPQGLDTEIGEEGLSLSGGQRQRLALARAVAARPRLLLLDDPLSALDTQTEAEVVASLRSTLAGTTTLLTAHRPSTVALADRVALLEQGRILAVGTHEELLALPAYRHVMLAADSAAADSATGAADGSGDGPADGPADDPGDGPVARPEEARP